VTNFAYFIPDQNGKFTKQKCLVGTIYFIPSIDLLIGPTMDLFPLKGREVISNVKLNNVPSPAAEPSQHIDIFHFI
jgi:hypothetical protein